MHMACYDAWLIKVEKRGEKLVLGKSLPPLVLLPGEEGLTREQISRRRHEILFGKRKPEE
jgi:hypothetical protein